MSDTVVAPVPLRLRQPAFAVAGPGIRTTRRHEQDPRAGRIAGLWSRFFDEERFRMPHRTPDARLYAVYSDYGMPDEDRAFTVTAGVAVSAGDPLVRIEAGDYLVFHGRGRMPQMVLATWERVDRFFAEHPEIRRRWYSDFEAYPGPYEVAIHIGVA